MKSPSKHPYLSIIILTLFYINCISAQITPPSSGQDETSYKNSFTFPQIIQSSPTVSGLMKMEEISLNKYVGQPTIAIPLFNKNIHGLKYNLALRYRVSGIRNTEMSGWVGTGWLLNAGGVISRTVVGLPDEYKSIFGKGINYSGFFNIRNVNHQSSPAKINQKRSFWYAALYDDHPRLDYEQDIYQFNFFGHTGKFIIDVENPITSIDTLAIPKIINQDSPLKIMAVHQGDWRSAIDRFEVTDANGFVYVFSTVEVTTTHKHTILNFQNGATAPLGPGDHRFNNMQFKSAWKLTKVKDSDGNVLLSIQYQDVIEKPKYPSNYVRNEVSPDQIRRIENYNGNAPGQSCNIAFSLLRPELITTFRTPTIASKKVSEIHFSDGVQLDFDLAAGHPEYREQKGAKLQRIKLLNSTNNTPVRIYNFDYNQSLASQKQLLFLDTISYDDVHYAFHYKDTENLAPFGEESTDAFGYYSSHSIGYGGNKPYRTEAASGALDKITYPTGGVRKYNWETNTYSFRGDDLIPKSEILNNPDNYSVTAENQTPSYNSLTHQATPSLITVSYDQTITFNFSLNFDPGYYEHNYWNITFTASNDPQDKRSFYLRDRQTGKQEVFLEAGTYGITLDPGIGIGLFDPNDPNPSIKKAHLNYHNKTLHNSLNWFVYGGGVRIRSIADYDHGKLQRKKNYSYQLENPPVQPSSSSMGLINTTRYSSGSFDGEESRVRKYVITEQPYRFPKDLKIHYQVKEVLNDLAAQLTHGSFIGYKNVAVYRNASALESSIVGSTPKRSVVKYTYDSPIDYPTFPDYYGFPFSPLPNRDYKRGNLRVKKIYQKTEDTSSISNNRLVKKETYAYNFDGIPIGEFEKPVVTTYHNRGGVPHQYYAKYFSTYDGYKDYITGPHVTYHDNLPCFISCFLCNYEIEIVPDAPFMGMSRQEVNYKSQLTKVHTTDYFYDNQDQVHTYPQQTEYTYGPTHFWLKEKTTKTAHDSTRTEYDYSGNGSNYLTSKHILNKLLGLRKFKNGQIAAALKNEYAIFNGTGVYLSKVQSSKYAPRGNSNGIHTDYTFEDRLVYHRYDTYGNPLDISKNAGGHIIYIWGYHHSLPVAKIVNATYSQVKNIVGNLSIAGNLTVAQKNNLRTQLKNAQVTTYVYDLINGITAITNPRGYTTRYTYDASGRLNNVIDQSFNLIKKYIYHYRNNQ